jgi:hypothetical protein
MFHTAAVAIIIATIKNYNTALFDIFQTTAALRLCGTFSPPNYTESLREAATYYSKQERESESCFFFLCCSQ